MQNKEVDSEVPKIMAQGIHPRLASDIPISEEASPLMTLLRPCLILLKLLGLYVTPSWPKSAKLPGASSVTSLVFWAQ